MTQGEEMVEVVSGFPVHMGYAYDLANHFWVAASIDRSIRVGMDALGLETSGTLAQLAFDAIGTVIERGAPFGTLEAEKFVGPLVAPVSGHIVVVNDAAMADPAMLQADPYGEGWMIQMEPSDLDNDRALLITGRAQIISSFEEKIRYYRLEGVLAE